MSHPCQLIALVTDLASRWIAPRTEASSVVWLSSCAATMSANKLVVSAAGQHRVKTTRDCRLDLHPAVTRYVNRWWRPEQQQQQRTAGAGLLQDGHELAGELLGLERAAFQPFRFDQGVAAARRAQA
jgi:hypothetical protein